MVVDDADPFDIDELRSLHGRIGPDYKFPDVNHPLFIVKKVCFNSDGKLIGACLLKLQAETYLLLEPDLTPVGKVEVMEALQPQVESAAWDLGLDTLVGYIPKGIARLFSKRLKKMKWFPSRDDWETWFKEF